MSPRGAALAGFGSALLSATAARGAYLALSRRPPGGRDAWERTNHRGEPVTLVEGPAAAVAAVTVAAVVPGLPGRVRAGLAAAGAGAAVFGCYDDLAGRGDRRGFRGHLGALARGEVTSGAVKIVGIGAAGLTTAGLLGGPPADIMINTALTAGAANLLNLFDLRPGRAIKVALAGGALLAAGAARAGPRRSLPRAGAAGRCGAGDAARGPGGAGDARRRRRQRARRHARRGGRGQPAAPGQVRPAGWDRGPDRGQ